MGLIIIGTRLFVDARHVRYLVLVNGERLLLPFRVFKALAILAVRRRSRQRAGWTKIEDVYYPRYLAYDCIKRLRHESGHRIDVESRHGSGMFRLRFDPREIVICSTMAEFDDADITREIAACGVRLVPEEKIELPSGDQASRFEARS